MKKLFVVIVVLLVCISVIIGCAKPAPAPSKPSPAAPATTAPAAKPTPTLTPKSGGVLTVTTTPAPTSWGYPYLTAGGGFGDNKAQIPCFEGFTDFTRDGTVQRPMLATAWQVAPDKSFITINLRKGVKFQDGTDFNADAAKWNLDRAFELGRGTASNWKSIEKIDDYTVRINLKKFQNTQLSDMDSRLMISPAAVQKNGIDWAKTNPVGTGPFKFKKFARDVSLEYERWDGWWGSKAYLDGIKYLYIADATTAQMAFESGEVQVMEEVTAKAAADLQKKGYKIINRRGPGMHLVPDSANKDSIYADKRIREAVEYAIDRPKIAATFGYGFWEPMFQPNVPEQSGHVPNLAGRQYNPEMSKKLLAEAGYPNGFNTKIITANNFDQDPLVSIKSYLSEVGIKAELEVVTPAKWTEYRNKGWNNALIYCTQGAEDYNYCAYLERYYVPYAANYASLLKPADMTKNIEEALAAADLPTITKLSQKVVTQFVNDCMAIPLWVQAAVYVLNPSVMDTGFATHGSGFRWSPESAWINK